MSASIIDSTLAGHETLLRFRTGETLFSEGDPPRGVYVLHSGTVQLLFAGKNGNAKPLRETQPGQILGLSCVVTQRPHDCTATAAEPCEVAFIEREEFLRTLDDSPAVWFCVLRILSSEVNAAYDDIRAISGR
ncbi:MAG TPA: cyclic nucleotide-binding domain-containing protein [Thermoanaerobaculia bacterium]|nr:cyclic nucleotide-binding domain-containing protein [Thermoanaerobaculia bacterium]